MHYKFPIITDIDDVLPAIKDFPEFLVAERDDYTVINYMVAKEGTFGTIDDYDSILRRECRGIIFDRDGNLISRRYHKFFNVNERAETREEFMAVGRNHDVLEKLDGSMITPIVIDGNVYWGTKMGITDVAVPVVDFVNDNPYYRMFAIECFENNLTPIFEWCSRGNRIVIDYPVPRLVLTAIRETHTGNYFDYGEMVDFAEDYEIDVVRRFSTSNSAVNYLINKSRGLEGMEGYVLRFEDGHMLKFKSDWYVRIHKAKELFVHPRHLAQLVLSETADDAKSIMLPDDRERLSRYEEALVHDLQEIAHKILTTMNRFDRTDPQSRKAYALSDKSMRLGIFDRTAFKNWDQSGDLASVIADVKNVVNGFTTANVKFDELRDWLPTSFKVFEKND